MESFSDEYERLRAEKTDIEFKLGGCSKAAMLKEQSRIRREGMKKHASIEAWIERKVEMEAERGKLLRRLEFVTKRMSAIKLKAREEKVESVVDERLEQQKIANQLLNEILRRVTSIESQLRRSDD